MNVSLCVKHSSFRCVSQLYLSQSTQVKFPRGLALGSLLVFLMSDERSGSLVLCGVFTWPLSYLDYRTLPIPILICFISSPISLQIFLVSGSFFGLSL